MCYTAQVLLSDDKNVRIRLIFAACLIILLSSSSLGLAAPPSPSASGHFVFRDPGQRGYQVADGPRTGAALTATAEPQLLQGWPDGGSTNYVLFESRVVLQLQPAASLPDLLLGRPLRLDRTINAGTFILQATDAWTAVRQAEDLARDSRVMVAHPVRRQFRHLNGHFALRPNDPLFFLPNRPQGEWQANLENRDTNGAPLGIDLNVRRAWSETRGDNVVIAIADDGFELDHPDLAARAADAPHFNFISGQTNGMPSGLFASHATAVAGLAAATANNGIGITGVAPEARLASWVIFGANDDLVSEEALMDMFQYQSNVVSVQNHSWGKIGPEQLRVSSLEDLALENAIQSGRSGRGVIIVRAGGNGREDGNDANEDGYVADPRVIGVAAARLDGSIARYSSPGACILVAAPSGDRSPTVIDPCVPDGNNLTTTDRQGSRGYNQDASTLGGDYTTGETGFSGTSAATPQIAGVAALLLGANPGLTYRDVQQILALSSRQTDPSDASLATNSAGFAVSHNMGFGVPDAGQAVQLARAWSNRPALTTVTYTLTNAAAIPEDGLRLHVDGPDVPENLRFIQALPGGGPHPDQSGPLLPLVDVGNAVQPIGVDLRGKVALIQRSPNFFCEKVRFAAQAGADCAIIYNNVSGTERVFMVETDRTPIPSYFIGQQDGEALRDYLAAEPSARIQVELHPANFTFQVNETLQCEFVGVHLDTTQTARGDLRIVLTSPGGTKSILQHPTRDTLPGPNDWTYYTVQNFFESSFGAWKLSIIDENDRGTGSVLRASLIIRGVAITDTDHDGLDDAWETTHFGALGFGPGDDPDHDGYSNAREQLMGTDPIQPSPALELDLSVWDDRLARLSWPSDTNTVYRVQIGSESPKPMSLLTNVPGRFPETEWFVPYAHLLHQFFTIQAVPRGN
ncbi:MAG: S8 family serine peptidase [Verrucomicrobiota bacterium]